MADVHVLQLIFDLAKRVRTPQDALMLALLSVALTALIYFIPADALED